MKLLDFIELIKERERSKRLIQERKFGIAKGLIEVAPNFDEPIGDFKDYM